MKRAFALVAAAAAVLAAPIAFAPDSAAAQARRDWTRTIVATPEGGFRMGNPAARLKVVEFVSLTCPHCRDFAATGARQLVDRYVRTGAASFEIRAFPLDPVAAMAAQLARCAPVSQQFAINDAMLAAQDQWIGRLRALSNEQMSALQQLPEPELRVRLASVMQLDAIAARHGVTAARLRPCLADEAGAQRIAAIRAGGERLGVSGTPSFLINGRLQDHVHDWTALEPLLRGR
ncbi:MAG TPA: thioredoxin domain-containing protein [Allosphingosinicella sp.]|nr:thioredoxin domain-containing protein [Allosphingosinicella sp.]HYG31201.1 thioredoxin domain-containing protein [Allosphingosinicella sp.]